MPYRLAVVVPTPAHSSIDGPLTYSSELSLAPGTLVRVPLGRREVLGVVWDADPSASGDPPAVVPKNVAYTLQGISPLSLNWRRLVTFSASYYQRSLGEVALAGLPPQLRALDAVQLSRRLNRAPAPGQTGWFRPMLAA